MKILEGTIVQVSAKNLLFRKCSNCRGKVTLITTNELDPGHDQFYCERCKKRVLKCNTSFKMNLTVMNILTRKLELLVVYDELVQRLLGCSPAEFDHHLKENPNLIHALEIHLAGLSGTFEIYTGRKAGMNGFEKCRKITLDEDTKIVSILLHQKEQPLIIDPELSALTT